MIAGTRILQRIGVASLGVAAVAWAIPAAAGFGAQGVTPPPSDGEPLAPVLGWQAYRLQKNALSFDVGLEAVRGALTQTSMDVDTGDFDTTYVLDGLAGMRLGARYGVTRRLELGIAAPIWFTNQNYGGPALGPAFGDISIYAPVGLGRRGQAGLSVVPWLTLPTGRAVRFLGDGGPGLGVQMVGSTRIGKLGLDAWLGVDWRTFQSELNVESGPGLLGGLAIGYALTPSWAVHLETRGQSRLRRGYTDGPAEPTGFAPFASGSELALTSRGRLKSGWWISGGAAGASKVGPGAAELRLLLAAGRTIGNDVEDDGPIAVPMTRFLIQDPDGKPIVGARVLAKGVDIAASDATGEAQAARKRWKPADGLTVRAPGFKDLAIEPPQAGAEVPVTLDWLPVTVTVRVVDEEGIALDAQLTARPGDNARATDAGQATYELQPGAWTLRASSQGFGAQERSLTLLPQGERAETVDFILLPQMGDGALDITLSDVSGEPVGSAEVALSGRPVGASASGGTLHIEGLGRSPVTIDAVADTFRDYSRPEVTPTAEVDLVLTRQRGAVQVVVRGPEGGVIDNASTRFVGPNRLGPFQLGDAGRRVFVLRPGTWQVLVSSPEYGLQQRAITIKDRDAELVVVEVVLQRPEEGLSDFTVRVRDHDNRAIDGATVSLDDVPYGTTSNGGELTLEDLQVGPRNLVVGGDMHESVQQDVFLYGGMQEATVLLPWLPGATMVSARSPQGMVADGTVRFAGPQRLAPLALGETGVRFTQLDPGLWQALVSSPSWGAQQQGVAIPKQSRSLHIIDALLNPGEAGVGQLTIEVVDPFARPVTGAEIALDHAALGATASSGTLSLMELQTGQRSLEVSATPYAPVKRAVQIDSQPRTERVKLAWGVGALLVTAVSDGKPVNDAVIRMGGPRFVAATPVDSKGQRLFGMEPASWQVLVSSPTTGITQQMVVIDDTPGLTEITIDLTPAPTGVADVLFRVQDPDGAPIAGAKVTVDDLAPVLAGEGGLALLNEVSPGLHDVSVEALSFEPLTLKNVPLDEGGQERILPMKWVPRELTVRVTGPDGEPVDAIVALDGPADVEQGKTGPDGERTLTVRPGTWQVLASTADLGAKRVEIVMGADDAPRKVSLQLDKAQVEVSGGGAVVIKDRVYFDTGKSTLKPSSTPILDEVAATLMAHPEIVHLEVQGHTDNVGGVAVNMRLSRERAQAVVQALVARGVAPERLRPRGLGPTRPVADNATDEGRAINRRVEFVAEVREE